MCQSISIILPNFNGQQLLKKNIPSLLEAVNSFEHEIIVVDDCSTDESVQFLKETYPDIKIIQNKINCGFSATCNEGIFAAKMTLLCIVNTDVTFTPDYFTIMMPEFSNKSLFAVKGDIVNYRNSYSDVINIGKTISLYFKHGFLRFDSKKPLTTKTLIPDNSTQFVTLGCCFVCNREIMLKLKGFDEIFSPFYWEDADLAHRAIKSGFKILYLPESKVFHQTSSTISNYRSNSKRRLVSIRNKFLFTWHHLDNRRIWLSHAPITLFNLSSRWLILDWKFYVAFILAIIRKLTFDHNQQKNQR